MISVSKREPSSASRVSAVVPVSTATRARTGAGERRHQRQAVDVERLDEEPLDRAVADEHLDVRRGLDGEVLREVGLVRPGEERAPARRRDRHREVRTDGIGRGPGGDAGDEQAARTGAAAGPEPDPQPAVGAGFVAGGVHQRRQPAGRVVARPWDLRERLTARDLHEVVAAPDPPVGAVPHQREAEADQRAEHAGGEDGDDQGRLARAGGKVRGADDLARFRVDGRRGGSLRLEVAQLGDERAAPGLGLGAPRRCRPGWRRWWRRRPPGSC